MAAKVPKRAARYIQFPHTTRASSLLCLSHTPPERENTTGGVGRKMENP